MRRRLPAPLAALIAASAVTLLAGCGETVIDQGKAEDFAKKVANGGSVKVKSVSCPKDAKAKKGATVECDLVYEDGAKGTITLHQTDDKGSVRAGSSDIHVTGP
jgi:hypothetical protein